MPRKQSVLGGKARDAEDLDGFMSEKRSKRRRRDAWGVQGERCDVDDVTDVVAERSIGEDQLANAMSRSSRATVKGWSACPLFSFLGCAGVR